MIKTQKWIKSTNTPELHSAVTLGRLHLYAVLFIFYLFLLMIAMMLTLFLRLLHMCFNQASRTSPKK